MIFKSLTVVAFLLFSTVSLAQVGIGTITPNGQLTIDSGTTDLAPLELVPMAAVPTTNLSAGQFTVIGDEMYLYDSSRSKWLSVSTMQLAYTRAGNAVSNQNLYYGGRVANVNGGAIMPFNGTIVHISSNSSGGNATKRFEIRIRNGGANVSVDDFNLVGGIYTDLNQDIDFSIGDNINVRARDDGNGDVSNPSVILWIKRRE